MRASSPSLQTSQTAPSAKFTKADLAKCPVRFQNAFTKRYESNLYQFNLKPKPAEDEALIFVGRLVYLAKCKAEAKAAQAPLFDMPKVSGKRGML